MTDDPATLEVERAEIFAGDDRDAYLHMGHFFTWFNMVEWQITNIMAQVMREKDFSAFHVLVGDMDARKKVRRLKRLCKVKNQTIEKPLLDRLEYFESKIYPVRTKIAHNALITDKSRFYYLEFNRLPWTALGKTIPRGLKQSDFIESLTLFRHASWLNHFFSDLTEALNRAEAKQPLGMTTPRAPLP
jgi:hypothetical protein